MNNSFVQWVGGKEWLTKNHRNLFHDNIKKHYIEPFLGGGNSFFFWKPKNSIISDQNESLIQCYKTLQKNHEKVLMEFKKLCPPDKQRFDNIKKNIFSEKNDFKFSAYFIYLNQLCFKGIMRFYKDYIDTCFCPTAYKRKGDIRNYEKEFREWQEKAEFKILNFGRLLKTKNPVIMRQDFEESIKCGTKESFIFCDPPYLLDENINEKDRFYISKSDNNNEFKWKDQERLSQALLNSPSKFMLTVRSSNYFFKKFISCDITKISRHNRVSNKIFYELVITNYKQKKQGRLCLNL